jgi:predicted nucleotidyltransferase/DNA-binding XRE family transcriptional regulator
MPRTYHAAYISNRIYWGFVTLSAKLIKEARTSAGLTQAELARRAGTSQPTVAAYESGAKVPTVGTLERLLRVAGARLNAQPARGKPRTVSLLRLLRKHRQNVLDLAAKHHATNVRVFGSVARGDATSVSDIDLLVDMEPGCSLLDQVRLRRALSERLGVEVDVVTSSGLFERDRKTILFGAVPL